MDQARHMGDFFDEVLLEACRNSPVHCKTLPAVVERDGSVNAELIYRIVGKSVYALIDELEMGVVWPSGDYWISLGVRYESLPGQRRRAADADEARYLKWAGVREIFDYGRHRIRAGYSWQEFQQRIIPRLLDQGFHLLSFHIRLHWNEDSEQPKNQREKKPWQKHYKRPKD
jgi:hypothetical protein